MHFCNCIAGFSLYNINFAGRNSKTVVGGGKIICLGCTVAQ